MTRADGSKLGWQPESLYVGYLVYQPAIYKRPPKTCPDCGSALEVMRG